MKRWGCLLLCLVILCTGCSKKFTAEDAGQLLRDTYGTEDPEMGWVYDFAYAEEQTVAGQVYYHFRWSAREEERESFLADLFVAQNGGRITEARQCPDGSWTVQSAVSAEELRRELTLHPYLGEATQQLYIFSDDGAVSLLSEAGGLRGTFEVYDAEGTLCLDMSIDEQRRVCSCAVWSDGTIVLVDQMQFGWTDSLTVAGEDTAAQYGGDIVG